MYVCIETNNRQYRGPMLVTGCVTNLYDPHAAQREADFAGNVVAIQPTEPKVAMAPHVASQPVHPSKIVEKKKPKRNLDEIEEISPAASDHGTKPATSSLYPRYDLWGAVTEHLATPCTDDGAITADIQEEEDAAMARRLAAQDEAKFWVCLSVGAADSSRCRHTCRQFHVDYFWQSCIF
jgi:hypothetical protein